MLNKDDQFFTDEIKRENAEWEKYLQMYLGAYIHNKVIDNNGNKVNIQPLIPLPMVASNISADLLFGEPLVVGSKNTTDAQIIADWMRKEEFNVQMLENAALISALGTMWMHVYKIDGDTKVVFRRPQEAISKESRKGLEKIYFLGKPEKQRDMSTIYSVDEHRYEYRDMAYKSPLEDPSRKYVIERYKVKIDNLNGKVINVFDVHPIEVTDLDTITICKVINTGISGSRWGHSDYAANEQMFAEIDNRVDQINYVLQENGDPWTLLPSGVLDSSGAFRRSQGKLIEKSGAGGNDNSVEVVQWDASLSAAFEQVRQLMKLLFFTLRISSPIAGIEDNGGNVESGRALKWKSISTFSMIKRKRVYMERMFNNLFKFLGLLSPEFANIDINGLEYKWADGLPLDDQAKVETDVALVEAGLMSHKTAIMDVQEKDSDSAQQELEQIALEKGTAADIDARRFRVGVE